MQALARPKEPESRARRAEAALARAVRARNQSDQRSPVNPRPPTRIISRRVMPSHSLQPGPRRESMRDLQVRWELALRTKAGAGTGAGKLEARTGWFRWQVTRMESTGSGLR